MNSFFASFNLAGFMYYDGVEVFNELKIGTPLQLVPEPENRHDEYAIALYYNKRKLGFVPRGENKTISKLLYFGHDMFTAKINRLSPDEHPNNQVGVVVRVKEKEKAD